MILLYIQYQYDHKIFSIQHVPRTIGFIQPILYLLLLYVVRSIFSYLLNYEQIDTSIKKNVALIYGSGNAGVQLLNSLENSDVYIEGFLDDNDQLIISSRLDNLGKGASGAAIQSMNIALGFDETLGL